MSNNNLKKKYIHNITQHKIQRNQLSKVEIIEKNIYLAIWETEHGQHQKPIINSLKHPVRILKSI
jgi:hypothetical protein